MDINGTEMASTIAVSSTDYLAVFSPIFLLIGGIVLAMGIVSAMVEIIYRRRFADDEDVI